MGARKTSKLISDRYKCPICGKSYIKQETNYWKSKSKIFYGNNAYLPYCRKCMEDLFQQVITLYPTVEEAIRHICIMLDIYYNPKHASSVAVIDPPKIADYIKKVSTFQKTYVDTLLEERNEANKEALLEQTNKEEFERQRLEEEISQEVKDFFGAGFTPDEYKFLTSEFKDWKARTGIQIKSAEELIKNVCFNQLDARRAREKGESTEKIEENFRRNIKELGISPNQNDNDAGTLSSWGEYIAKIEETRPISDTDEEFRDVDSIGQYIEAFLTVPLANSIGLKGVVSKAYDELIERYSVKNEVVDVSEENEDIFEAALGKRNKVE